MTNGLSSGAHQAGMSHPFDLKARDPWGALGATEVTRETVASAQVNEPVSEPLPSQDHQGQLQRFLHLVLFLSAK